MSEPTNQDEAATSASTRKFYRPLRLWPAVLIALAHIAVKCGFLFFGATNVQNFVELVLVPVGGALLLVIWWLALSRAPWRDRFVGLVAFAGALLYVVFTQKTRAMGGALLAYALPAITLGVVAVLVATYRLRWPVRRWIVVVYMLACAGVFSAMRVDSLGGDLAPIVSWRWNPTAQERSDAMPRSEVHNAAVLPAQVVPEDWPAFRGPARDGRLTGTKFSTDWTTPPREVWRKKIGPAWSSFIAVGDYLFTQEQRGEEELVTCYRAATGEEVWANRVAARFEDGMGLGPRATPTFLDGKLYTQGATGVLQCLDASTGSTIWKRDVAADCDTKVPGYGFTSSPLVVGDRVFEFSCGPEGKSAIAYDRATGAVAWRAGLGGSNYTSPHFAVLDGVPQVLMIGEAGMQAFVPETGASLWEFKSKTVDNPRCVQPLIVDSNRVMMGATGRNLTYLLRVEKKDASWAVKEEWNTKNFRPYFNDGVLHKGYCYGFDGDRLACIDVNTAERKWEGKRYVGQLVLLADMDALLVLSEKGDVALVQAVPDGFNEIARFKALTGKTWNHPVVAHGRLFVRNAEEAVCYELGGGV